VKEPAVIAFANTRSSLRRDHIATLPRWRDFIAQWPGLRTAGHRIDEPGLIATRQLRDDVQNALRAAATTQRHDAEVIARLCDACRTPAGFTLRWRAGRPTLSVAPDADPAAVIGHHLARMALDLLLTAPPLTCCAGDRCLKVFLAARAHRRWCDSAVCGNRARVRAHHDRRVATAG
jgi:predicted RNA-binding Zn ribbon-like protein